MAFNTEEEIWGGAAGEQPGSQAAYQKELAQRRFLMDLQRERDNSQLTLQREALAVQKQQAQEQFDAQEAAQKLQREFNDKQLRLQEEIRDIAADQSRSAKLSAKMAAAAVVVATLAILASMVFN